MRGAGIIPASLDFEDSCWLLEVAILWFDWESSAFKVTAGYGFGWMLACVFCRGSCEVIGNTRFGWFEEKGNVIGIAWPTVAIGIAIAELRGGIFVIFVDLALAFKSMSTWAYRKHHILCDLLIIAGLKLRQYMRNSELTNITSTLALFYLMGFLTTHHLSKIYYKMCSMFIKQE